ncbi:SDR family oxidoreductase (plasmid) [Rhodococcus sp. ZPP]|uniref:SDR family oxidoreductase n=1 Tax=Rhodococcus sp. ZPP TaxID=2749906 RepID=UPI001AD860B2|nr:SDR family oxidoreductase [Rhodococcus sp. ZPP]QTJ70530.1 SDR family oxidoreductase [Rhodococcus sp. ZPP]
MNTRVLITGASSGLGAGMAKAFAARGCDLVLTARRLELLEKVKAEIEQQSPGRRVLMHQLDVTDHDAVFEVFAKSAAEMGGLDRIVVNAGIGKGGRVGSGRFAANRDTALTNFIAGIAQCEAAMELFYRQGTGHLVVMSSVTAGRGLPGPMNVYAATKAALAHLAEGIRSDVKAKQVPIKVSTIRPGYIESEMQDRTGKRHPLLVEASAGAASLVRAIEREVEDACVPWWPWTFFELVLRFAPDSLVKRIL